LRFPGHPTPLNWPVDLSNDPKGRVLFKRMLILVMDFLQFKDLIQQTGYIILVIVLVGSVVSSLQTISIRVNTDDLSSFRFFITLFLYTVAYVIFFTVLIIIFATLYNVIIMNTGFKNSPAFF
jgi:hypothetical protein